MLSKLANITPWKSLLALALIAGLCFIPPQEPRAEATDLSITVASVATSSGNVNKEYLAAATITAGQCVYLNSSNAWALAQCDGTAAEAGSGGVYGFALHAALSGQPLAVQTSGTIAIGATVTVGTDYVISATAGGVAPRSDLDTGKYITVLGIGQTSSTINMGNKYYSGLKVP